MEELALLIEQLLAVDSDDARIEVLRTRDLGAVEREMVEAANQLIASDDDTPETLDTLQALAGALDSVRAEQARRATAAAERAETLATIGAQINKADETDPEPDPEVETLAADTADEPTAEEAEPAPQPEPVVAEPVTAQVERRQPSLAALKRVQPADTIPVVEAPRVKVKAALDVPGFSVGSLMRELRDLAAALISRQEALGAARGGSVSMEKVPVAQFNYIDELKQLSTDPVLNGLALHDARRPNALTAAGGFCAPKETIYDFVKVSAPEDLVQDFLPTVGASRGSIEYPTSPDIRDANAATLTKPYSAAQDTAADPKTVYTVACPTFVTCTVGAQYVILKFGNFGTRAYPEWVQHWIGLAMDAHAHAVSRKLIFQMVALSDAVVGVGPNAGATSTVLSNIDMAAADYRQDLRMSRTAQLDVMLPSWTPDLIRSDLARASKGTLDTLAVSDGQINTWLGARNITPRYVTDWQNISGNAQTGTSTWPAGLDFLVYSPGTFVRLDMGTLDLGVVRDSTLNTTNDYHIFIETFESVCKPGIESRLYSASICATGAFSDNQNLSCAGIDTPAS